MTNTDKKTKQFNREQIQHCLAIIDQLKPSGLNTLEFASTQGLSYGQIRAWQSLAPRWRAKLTEDITTAPTRRRLAKPPGFVQVKSLPTAMLLASKCWCMTALACGCVDLTPSHGHIWTLGFRPRLFRALR